jgi:isocitrate dehydrogenase
MMKISDQLFFGAIVEVFFAAVFEKYSTLFTELNDTRNGLGDVYAKLQVILNTEVETAITQAMKMVQV